MEKEGLLGQDTGWQEVVSKKKKQVHGGGRRLDVATIAWKISYKDTISFYFSEFPDTHGAKEMLRAFKLYGDAMEVVIPPKRDRWGKRFGFVRFMNVEDPRTFAVKLDNIIFGANKIHVNLPKFQRERHENHISRPIQQQREAKGLGEQPWPSQQRRSTKRQEEPKVHEARKQQFVWRKKEGGDVVGRDKEGQHEIWRKRENGGVVRRERERQQHYQGKNKNWNVNNGNNGAPKIVYHRKNNIAEVCYSVPEEEMQKFKKMFVGTVKTPGSTYSVHEWFSMQGFFSLKITSLGANKVLMEEMEDGVFEELMTNYKEWMYEKFEDIRGWEPDVVDNERVVWVRCHGIPIHAWNETFFASLARTFGEYLGVDDATRTRSEMDVARIRLRSNGYDVFNAVVTANINGSLFHIKIIEEWCGPLQWIENNIRKTEEADDDSESDDDHGDGPPLFTADGDWASSNEEERDDGVEGSDYEEERDTRFDDTSFVQDTFVGLNDDDRRCNDCLKGREVFVINDEVNADLGNQIIPSNEVLRVGVEARDEVQKYEEEETHISNTIGESGGNVNVKSKEGVNAEITRGVFEEATAMVSSEATLDQGVLSKKGGCDDQMGGLGIHTTVDGGVRNEGECEVEMGLPITKKRRKKVGPFKVKKKEKKRKKKEKESQLPAHELVAEENKNTEFEEVSQHSATQAPEGVVRNPLNQFQPSSSMSVSANSGGVNSQVESVGDSGIMMGNNRFEMEMERSKSAKLWRIAKDKLGVSADEDEDEMFIERLRAMEERDKIAKNKKGKTNRSR